MPKYRITYHMKNLEEIAETCVDVPMNESYASILREQGASGYLEYDLRMLLYYLAKLQGYTFTEIRTIEEVE